MDTEKKTRMYKVILIVCIAVIVTFLLTAVGFHYYYLKIDDVQIKLLERVIEKTGAGKEVEARIELVRKEIDKYYLGEINNEKLVDAAVKGYVEGLRRHIHRISYK